MIKLLSPEEVAQQLGVTVNRLTEMRMDGTGPDYVKLGHRTIRYREDDVDQYIVDNWVELDANSARKVARITASLKR